MCHALARLPDPVTCSSGEVARAMVMNWWRHRELGNRHWWTGLIQTLHAALLVPVFFVGGCVAILTGHVGSGEAAMVIGGVLAVLYLRGWLRRPR